MGGWAKEDCETSPEKGQDLPLEVTVNGFPKPFRETFREDDNRELTMEL